MSSTEKIVLLDQGIGYGLILGLGTLFSIVILVAVRLQKRYLGENSSSSEMFMVANRTVGAGLTASAVFSSWFWANEPVYASTVAYNFGVGSPAWYITGLCYQIALMGLIGIQCKLRVPNAHTSLEIVRVRYGKLGHIIFLILNLINNIIGCTWMLISAVQLINGLTGTNIVASSILVPLGVIIYTALGGIKSTFITDYLHTTIALIILIYLTVGVLTNEQIGGVYGLYDKIVKISEDPANYVAGNYQGSLLSMRSEGSAMFGVVIRIGNLALTVMDTAFWQKSFSSSTKAAGPGYLIAAVAIIAAPWGLGTVMGLSARYLEINSASFPTYPYPISVDEINQGFVAPYVIKAVLGTGGAVAFLILLFMSVTSTVSSSLIAVSSLLSYDIYRTYINPRANDRQVVAASHITVVLYGALIAGLTIIFNYCGISMNWLGYVSPLLTGAGIFPLLLTVYWKRQSKAAALISPVVGMLLAITTWLVVTKTMYGEINITTTSNQPPCLYGALVALFSPLVLTLLITAVKPARFDWTQFFKISLLGDVVETTVEDEESVHSHENKSKSANESVHEIVIPSENNEEKPTLRRRLLRQLGLTTDPEPSDKEHPFSTEDLLLVRKWRVISLISFVSIILITMVIWPMSMYRDYIFSKSFFAGWVSVAIFWQFLAFFLVVVYPVYDGWHALSRVVRGIFTDSSSFLERKRR